MCIRDSFNAAIWRKLYIFELQLALMEWLSSPNRISITFWLDDEVVKAWYEAATPSSRGRPQRYSDLAITTVLVIKRVFRLILRTVQGFIDSIFALMDFSLRCAITMLR